jgi:hypothetical protein
LDQHTELEDGLVVAEVVDHTLLVLLKHNHLVGKVVEEMVFQQENVVMVDNLVL